MQFSAIVARFENEYATLDDGGAPVSTATVRAMAAGVGVSPASLCDMIAAYLVEGFHRGKFGFTYCDVVANRMFEAVIDLAGTTSFAWDTYLAFDTGEYYREGDIGDPSIKYTKPLIAQLYGRLKGAAE
jgi:hypothetical protein